MAKRVIEPQVHLSLTTQSVLNVAGARELLDKGCVKRLVIVHRVKGKLYLTPLQADDAITVLTLRRRAVSNAIISLGAIMGRENIKEGHYSVRWDSANGRLEIVGA